MGREEGRLASVRHSPLNPPHPSSLVMITSLIVLVSLSWATSEVKGHSSTCPFPGYFVNPGDCSRFYRCADQSTPEANLLVRFDFNCPPGTLFDQSVNVCVSSATGCPGGWSPPGWTPPSKGWTPPSTGWTPPSTGWTPPTKVWTPPSTGWTPPSKGWYTPPEGWLPSSKGWSAPWSAPADGWSAPDKGWSEPGWKGWSSPSKGWSPPGWPSRRLKGGWSGPLAWSLPEAGWGWGELGPGGWTPWTLPSSSFIIIQDEKRKKRLTEEEESR